MNDYARLRQALEAAWAAPADSQAAILAETLRDRPDLLAEAATMLRASARAESHFGAISERLGREGEAELAAQIMHGRRFGAYRVLRRLGSGGMGEVWLGERCDGQFEREVAIKLLAPGIAAEWTAPHLAAEQRILAGLDHPGIGRLLDAGIDDDGRPYLIEEYVAGRRWDEVVPGLPLAARVRLLIEVCAAVAHAHGRLVAHGDIKPGNVLIDTAGQPRLIDFGIARWLGAPDGAGGGTAATPAYAAPEQLESGSVTAATDIHALGLLLREAIGGARSAPLPQQSGDLGVIVARATQRDPQRRHPSVAVLAQDLENWLAQRPLASQPVSARRRMQLFLRRHPWACAVTAAVLLSWLALTVQIERQSRRIAQERDRAAAVTEVLVDLYSAADPSRAHGRETSLTELLDAAVTRLAARDVDANVRAQLQRVLARTYQALGAHEAATPLIEAALAHYRSTPDAIGDVAATLVQSGENARLATQPDLARQHFDAALEVYREDPGAASAQYLDTLAKRARLATLGGQAASVRGDLQAALAGTRALRPADPTRVAERLNDLAAVDFAVGDFAGARQHLTEAVALREGADGSAAISPELATSLNNLGLALLQQGDNAAARVLLERALAQRRQLLPATHRDIAQTLSNLGVLLQGVGELDRAEALLGEALAIRAQALGDDHAQAAQARNNLALVLQDRGELDGAVAAFRSARATLHAQLPDKHPLRAQADHNLGQALLEAGALDEARTLLQAALTARREQLPAGHPHLAWSLVALGRALLEDGAVDQAQALLAEAAPIRAALASDDWLRLEAELALARAQWRAGDSAAGQRVRVTATQLAAHPGSLGRQGQAALAELGQP